jgi:futalosine hydrolase
MNDFVKTPVKSLILTVPKFLIVAATQHEIQPLINWLNIAADKTECLVKANTGDMDISVLVTGAGMVNTAFNLGKYLNDSYDHVINAGICGAFNRNLKIGEVVNITDDCFSEMGAENDQEFIRYNDLNLGGSNCFMNRVKLDYSWFSDLKEVKGITVNTIHGNEEKIKKTISFFHPDVESMEGAAFFRSCQNIPAKYLQLRAVSNYVEKRDKSKWDIPLAINNVNEFVIKMIRHLNGNQPVNP